MVGAGWGGGGGAITEIFTLAYRAALGGLKAFRANVAGADGWLVGSEAGSGVNSADPAGAELV